MNGQWAQSHRNCSEASLWREHAIPDSNAPSKPGQQRNLSQHASRLEQYVPGLAVEDASIRLLIVDDHSVVRHGIASWFCSQKSFFVVGEAGTAQEAVGKAVVAAPDIVLLDVTLGDGGGAWAAQRILNRCPLTKIIAFSASADLVHVKSMLASGALGYVLKTSEEPSTIMLAIRAVLSGKRYLDPGLSDGVAEELGLFPTPTRHLGTVLSPREKQVLQFTVSGYTSGQIARELFIKPTSVNKTRTRIYDKLQLTSKAELVRYAMVSGLMESCCQNLESLPAK